MRGGSAFGFNLEISVCAMSEAETEPSIPEALKPYAATIQASIDSESVDLFRNESAEHAAVILRLFLQNAKYSLRVFCQKMSRCVYGDLSYFIKQAIERGVDVRVITQNSQVDSKEAAMVLNQHQSWRVNASTDDLPHFALADGMMFRLETDREKKKAVVCTHVAPDDRETQELVDDMNAVFSQMWEESQEPALI